MEPEAWARPWFGLFLALRGPARFAPNRHGLYDMAGNAGEWCEDIYQNTSHVRVWLGGTWNCVLLVICQRHPMKTDFVGAPGTASVRRKQRFNEPRRCSALRDLD